jgi:hypothetical protein
MISSAAVALAALAAVDFLMFGDAYTHLVKEVADSFLHQCTEFAFGSSRAAVNLPSAAPATNCPSTAQPSPGTSPCLSKSVT